MTNINTSVYLRFGLIKKTHNLGVATESRYDRIQRLRKELNGMVRKSAPKNKGMKMPVFGQKYYKRHDLYNGKNERNDSGFAYDPILRNLIQDTPKIEHLRPSWLATALVNLGRHLGTIPEGTRSSHEGSKPSPVRSSIVTDRDTIMRLNFRHVLRGA